MLIFLDLEEVSKVASGIMEKPAPISLCHYCVATKTINTHTTLTHCNITKRSRNLGFKNFCCEVSTVDENESPKQISLIMKWDELYIVCVFLARKLAEPFISFAQFTVGQWSGNSSKLPQIGEK